MTQEDKELLIKDLCGRLPYGVFCDIYNEKCTITEKLLIGGLSHFCDDTITVRPYLRPMSSMTDGELIEFLEIRGMNLNSEELKTFREGETAIVSTLPSYSRHIDWLNANHFDYRRLIPKGLAIEAPDGMYNNKEEQ